MQRTAKGKPKVLNKCTLTSARTVDLVVIEMAVIGFPGGRATLIETGAVVSVEQVVAATEAKLVLPEKNSADADLRLRRNQKMGRGHDNNDGNELGHRHRIHRMDWSRRAGSSASMRLNPTG